MWTLRLSLAGTLTLVLLGGLGAVGRTEEPDAVAFPTGTFVSVEDSDMLLEFDEDGTGRAHSIAEGWTVPFIYATRGDLYTEMMFDYPAEPKVPATYYWDFDGEHLTMELWGVDYQSHRNYMYADNTWRLVQDPVEVADGIDGQTVADMVNEAIATGDPDAIEAIFAPDALFILDDEVVADGRDALVAMIPGIPNTFQRIGPVAEYVASDGDLYVAALIEITGPGHPTGDPLVGFWRVRDGMVIRHVFMDAEHY